MHPASPRGPRLVVAVLLPLRYQHFCRLLEAFAIRLRDTTGWEVAPVEGTATDEVIGQLARAQAYLGSLADPAVREHVLGRRLPAVQVSNTVVVPGVHAVLPGDREAGQLAGSHLARQGARRFAFAPTWEGSAFARERAEGTARGLRPLGHRLERFADIDAAVAWVASDAAPAGLVAPNDLTARMLATALHRAGLGVPHRAAVIGFDDDTLDSALSPVPLSAIRPASAAMGREAADLLVEAARGTGKPRRVRVPPEGLVARRSTEMLAVESPRVARLLALMREDIAAHGSVATLARKAGTSVRTLQDLFRRSLGTSVREEIAAVRLERARFLLRHSDQSLGEIAAAVGLADAATLSHFFRRREGMTPGAFRRLRT